MSQPATFDSCERIVYDSPVVVLGEFRCPRDYSNFAHAGRITRHVVAFPRCAVWIEREDSPRFVADPGLSTIYNPRDQYVRAPISREGDNSDWIGIPETTAREIAAVCDPSADHSDAAFRFPRASVSNATFMAQRRLFRSAQSPSSDRLRIDEEALDLVEDVIKSATIGARRGDVPKARARDLAEAAKEALTSTLFDNLGVSEIAAALGVSAFHLCRTFRAVTGTTLHAYRREIRLRVACDLASLRRGRLSSLAFDTGFNSHSHFTAAFRRAFGHTPSGFWRRRA